MKKNYLFYKLGYDKDAQLALLYSAVTSVCCLFMKIEPANPYVQIFSMYGFWAANAHFCFTLVLEKHQDVMRDKIEGPYFLVNYDTKKSKLIAQVPITLVLVGVVANYEILPYWGIIPLSVMGFWWTFIWFFLTKRRNKFKEYPVIPWPPPEQ